MIVTMNVYTVADIAELLGIEPATIRSYASRGQMPAPSGKVGRTPYWDKDDIEPWIAERVNRDDD